MHLLLTTALQALCSQAVYLWLLHSTQHGLDVWYCRQLFHMVGYS